MRHLIYYIATSIDGMIAEADGSTDRFTSDPSALSALAELYPQSFPTPFHQQLGIAEAASSSAWSTVVMGRETFEPARRAGLRSPYAHLDQYVVSTTLSRDIEPEVTLVDSDPVEFIRRLKSTASGDIWLCGGGRLAASLHDEIDRLIVKVNPFIAGQGRPLFSAPLPSSNWSLMSRRDMPAGIVVLEYERALAA
ncbi:dihydrofolate reductase family protein [Microcella sp.]|uniref:dihydrofolate reductase family protein n=1 Tax=Microcella sp. TaxID=1913979 RepID=UPI0025684DE2|nr:dihydrofolate reductase family protein [Microcella sp.]MBX9470670.1 dihydrofolate reductase family protein [Microcella sp.]